MVHLIETWRQLIKNYEAFDVEISWLLWIGQAHSCPNRHMEGSFFPRNRHCTKDQIQYFYAWSLIHTHLENQGTAGLEGTQVIKSAQIACSRPEQVPCWSRTSPFLLPKLTITTLVSESDMNGHGIKKHQSNTTICNLNFASVHSN